ncbi:membrane-associated phospholipid phosphatase [Nocardiopsis mwathae]|uniref:Membrane-associated phospholipid phosphatase n=1 Tax=Nocardiopsis mwathae TaxID=1472723 RepID=A0A7X0D5H7_9ACTN|nr:phosphatase PAP2 family protein [Nocardiopsis mwathae]MBB6172263.1 membrane-associated phospholipid phosphatase [Nocardiopsis mwathae]
MDLAAQAATESLSPAIVVCLIIAATTLRSTPTPAQAALWASVVFLFGVAIPMGYVYYGIQRGWWNDRHVHARAHRRWPFAVCLTSVATGTLVTLAAGGPRDMAVLGGTMGATLAVLWAITDRGRWKVSVHTVVAVVGAGIFSLLYGAATAAIAWPLAAVVAWSRIHLRHHTPAQVAGGALIGAMAMAAFAFLR